MVGQVDKIKNMVRLEENNASSLTAGVEGLKNSVVQEILRGIAYDSRKHAGLYTAIIDLLTGSQPAIGEDEYIRLEDILKKHIEVEGKMLLEVKQLLAVAEDSRIKHLLSEIHDDEEKHHALMKRLLDAVIKRETIFEKDVWDMLWMDVPGHGAPLG
jgi:rubrerythrin